MRTLKQRKRWKIAGVVCCLLFLAACGVSSEEQESPQASTPEECQMQLKEKLEEYKVQWDVLTEQMEQFYAAVEQGTRLEQQTEYGTFQATMKTWCDEINSYVLPTDWEACQRFHEQLKVLAKTTETFLTEMESVQTTEDMEAAMDWYIQNAAPVLAELKEAEGEETETLAWLIGSWNATGEREDTPLIYTYQEDGTVLFPDGTQYIWRRKGPEETENAELWKAEFPETTAESQIYYLSKDGADVMKQVVTKWEDGTLQVMTAVLYSEDVTSATYVPISQG